MIGAIGLAISLVSDTLLVLRVQAAVLGQVDERYEAREVPTTLQVAP